MASATIVFLILQAGCDRLMDRVEREEDRAERRVEEKSRLINEAYSIDSGERRIVRFRVPRKGDAKSRAIRVRVDTEASGSGTVIVPHKINVAYGDECEKAKAGAYKVRESFRADGVVEYDRKGKLKPGAACVVIKSRGEHHTTVRVLVELQ